MNNWSFLLIAIVAEVIATSSLKSSAGFSKLWPSLIVIIGYGTAFYCLSLALQTIPVGIAYAVWSGLGVIMVTVIAWVVFGQRLDTPALIGMLFIVLGVVVINLFSKAVPR